MAVGLYSGVSGLALGVGLYKGVSGLWGGASGLINGFGGSGPFPGASLYLDFLTPPLDSRITFSRGSNATLVDATGKITYAPNNQLTYSQDFSNAAWVATTATKTTGVSDPLGGTTACTVTATAGNGQILQSAGGSAGTSTTYITSIWLRRRTGTGTVSLFNPNGAGITAVTLTSSWAQYSVVGFGSASLNYNGVRLATSGDEVDVAFAQLEQVTYQTTPSTYVATTASAYYGPRFDYDPVTLAPKGLLIEEARTNLLTYSNDISNAAWAKTNITVTAAATASPDGSVNAQRLQAIAAVPTVVNNVPVAVAATSATYSIYVKQGTGPNTANVFLFRNNTTATLLVGGSLNYATGAWAYSTGSTGVTVSNAGNGWWRIQMTATTGITSGDALHGYVGWTGASAAVGDFMYAYGAQLEAATFATSYIPTVASTVTRSADVATMTGTNFSSWYNQTAGTFVTSADTFAPESVFPHIISVSNGSGAELIQTRFVAGSAYNVVDNSVEQANISLPTPAANTPQTRAITYAVNDFAAAAAGGLGSVDTFGSLPTVDRIYIGIRRDGLAEFLNGHIRQIAYYNTRLPNAQLQTLTAPSLATTLTMSFTDQAYTVGV